MNSYQLLFIGPANEVRLAQSVFGENDAQAIDAASHVVAGRVSELWNGGRLVRRFDPRTAAGAA